MAKQSRFQFPGVGPPAPPKKVRPVPEAVLSKANDQSKVTAALVHLGYAMAKEQRVGVNVLTGTAGILVVGAHTVKVYRGELLERNMLRQASTSLLARFLTLTGDFDEFVAAVQKDLCGSR